jgi:hypothetical protein
MERNQKKGEEMKDPTIKSITDLIYLLESDPKALSYIERQRQEKRINLLWETLVKLTTTQIHNPIKLEENK